MNHQLLTDARAKIADILEELGGLSTNLREAAEFAENGNIPAAVSTVDDALEAIDTARKQLAFLRLGPGRWAVWAEGTLNSQSS
jgi:sarcosine oxidase gamma subunit